MNAITLKQSTIGSCAHFMGDIVAVAGCEVAHSIELIPIGKTVLIVISTQGHDAYCSH